MKMLKLETNRKTISYGSRIMRKIRKRRKTGWKNDRFENVIFLGLAGQ